MRSDPADFQLIAPGSLRDALSLLASAPGKWLPLAGGTDIMVLYAAGKLASRNLVNIARLPELCGVQVKPNEIRIGACCTYTEIREHPLIAGEFPLLAQAARWTGGIANQNRGTLGGNIANASPAADSLPALLVYEADLILVSVRGERTVPYLNFHTGYKKMTLAPDELIQAIILKRTFSGYFQYSRKVGARNAQAISKVCIAGVGKLQHGSIIDVRVALGSVAPIPVRLSGVERTATHQAPVSALINSVRDMTQSAIQPIDDIRSTSRYRSAVAANLVAEFFFELGNARNDS